MQRSMWLAVLVVVVVVVSGCSLSTTDAAEANIVSVTHKQTKAVPDFDSTDKTTTDATQIADLKAVLVEHSIGLDGEIGSSCPGSTTTTITSTLADGQTRVLVVKGCSDDPGVKALESLITGWRQ